MEKRFYRLRRNKMLGGVCSGLAEYFNIDPVLIRIIFIILVFQHGIGFLAYIILWIVVPMKIEAPGLAFGYAGGSANEGSARPGEGTIETEFSEGSATAQTGNSGRRSKIGGIALIVIGILFLLDNFIPGFDFEHFWPLLLIAIGTGIVWKSLPRSTDNEVTS